MITNPAGRLAGIYLALRQKIYEGVPWTYDTLLDVGFSGLVICKYPATTKSIMVFGKVSWSVPECLSPVSKLVSECLSWCQSV